MNYVLLSDREQDMQDWYRWAKLLPNISTFVHVMNASDQTQEWRTLDPEQTILIVTHPYWVQEVQTFKPKATLVFLDAPTEGQHDSLYEKCRVQLIDYADVIFSKSETTYLNLCFHTGEAFLMGGDEQDVVDAVCVDDEIYYLREYERLFIDVVQGVQGNDEQLRALQRRQWQSQVAVYRKMLVTHDKNERIHYFLAVYLYLLGDPQATESLSTAFQLGVLRGTDALLQQIIRFQSALEAKAGRLAEAIQIYGISCTQPTDRETYRQLLEFWNREEFDLALASLYLLNDDVVEASQVLHRMSTPDAQLILFRTFLKAGRFQEARQLISSKDMRTNLDRKNFHLLEGTLLQMKRPSRAAISSFLRAAVYDQAALAHVVEMEAVNNRIKTWSERGEKVELVPIRKARDNKLTAMMQVRNEEGRYLEAVLQEVSQFVDEIVIVDDASTDRTVLLCQSFPKVVKLVRLQEPLFQEEWKLRKLLWEATLTTEPDWVLSVDADEFYEQKAKERMRMLIEQEEFDWVGFRFFDFWGGTTHYRDDEHWSIHRRHTMTLLRVLPYFPAIIPQMNHHVSRLPISYQALPGFLAELRVKHYGWAGSDDERKQKYERYLSLDPQGQWGSLAHYHSILDSSPHLVEWKE